MAKKTKTLTDKKIKDLIKIVKDHGVFDWDKDVDETDNTVLALERFLQVLKYIRQWKKHDILYRMWNNKYDKCWDKC